MNLYCRTGQGVVVAEPDIGWVIILSFPFEYSGDESITHLLTQMSLLKGVWVSNTSCFAVTSLYSSRRLGLWSHKAGGSNAKPALFPDSGEKQNYTCLVVSGSEYTQLSFFLSYHANSMSRIL